MNTERAGCHCNNITVEVTLSGDLAEYTPRACDCDFCIKNGAAYVSDSKGKLAVKIRNPEESTLYKQGDNLVELLICKQCGVMVCATYTDGNEIYGTLNSKTLSNRDQLSPSQVATPKLLSPEEKIERWKALWFPDVTIHSG